MNDFETIKMLYLEHHRQMTARREKIHGITERTVGVLMLVCGWLVIADTPLLPFSKWILLALVITVAASSCYSVYLNNRKYLDTAAIVLKLSTLLGLYEVGKYLPEKPLYLESSQPFGARGIVDGALPHWAIITVLAVLGLISALLK